MEKKCKIEVCGVKGESIGEMVEAVCKVHARHVRRRGLRPSSFCFTEVLVRNFKYKLTSSAGKNRSCLKGSKYRFNRVCTSLTKISDKS